jgi:hypothetical protein
MQCSRSKPCGASGLLPLHCVRLRSPNKGAVHNQSCRKLAAHASNGCSRKRALLTSFKLSLVIFASSTSSRRMCDHGMGEFATRLHGGRVCSCGVAALYSFITNVHVIAAPVWSLSDSSVNWDIQQRHT